MEWLSQHWHTHMSHQTCRLPCWLERCRWGDAFSSSMSFPACPFLTGSFTTQTWLTCPAGAEFQAWGLGGPRWREPKGWKLWVTGGVQQPALLQMRPPTHLCHLGQVMFSPSTGEHWAKPERSEHVGPFPSHFPCTASGLQTFGVRFVRSLVSHLPISHIPSLW